MNQIKFVRYWWERRRAKQLHDESVASNIWRSVMLRVCTRASMCRRRGFSLRNTTFYGSLGSVFLIASSLCVMRRPSTSPRWVSTSLIIGGRILKQARVGLSIQIKLIFRLEQHIFFLRQNFFFASSSVLVVAARKTLQNSIISKSPKMQILIAFICLQGGVKRGTFSLFVSCFIALVALEGLQLKVFFSFLVSDENY